jgi:hypothetical protein
MNLLYRGLADACMERSRAGFRGSLEKRFRDWKPGVRCACIGWAALLMTALASQCLPQPRSIKAVIGFFLHINQPVDPGS